MILHKLTDEQLRAVLAFFGSGTLRSYYTGLIYQLRREIENRAG